MWELVQRITNDSEKTLDAIMDYGRKAEALNNENPLALMSISAAYFFRGEHLIALDYAHRALQFNPSLAFSYFWLSLAKFIQVIFYKEKAQYSRELNLVLQILI